jgi:5'-nucleotidase
MSKLRRPVVAVDLDDVCADRLGVIADMLRIEGAAIEHRQPANWDLSDWGVRDKPFYDRLHYTAFVDQHGYRSMPPLPGALDGLRQLHDWGFLIRIVTGRLWDSQVLIPALSDTAHWLARYSVPVDDVAFVSDKTVVDADVYIEDAPHFITDLQGAGRCVIAMGTRYNRHLPGIRVKSWTEVLRRLPDLLPHHWPVEEFPATSETR